MSTRLLAATLLLTLSSVALADAAPATQPRHRVLIISIDGLRPDLMLRARTPVLTGLMDSGCYTCWAQTTAVSVTLPSHVSMLTGVKPQKHKIEWNSDLPFSTPIYPAVPTLFELAHSAGYSTAIATGKSKFDVLNKPGTIDHSFVPEKEVIPDSMVVDRTISIINESAPEVLFVHLPWTDKVGHSIGWGTPEQLQAISRADAAVGRLLDELESRQLLAFTLVIITADHGGAGKNHGPDDVRCRNIPWIAVGPGVRHNFDLTRYPDLTIKTEDTFATAAAFLGLRIPAGVDGNPVRELFDAPGSELLTTVGGK